MVLNSDDFLLAGHGRRDALLTMKGDGDPPPKNIEAEGDEWIVPVGVGPDFDQREGTAYRLVDNRSTELGGYDEPQLLENLIALSKNGGLEATGYDGEDIDRLFQLLNPDLEEVQVSDEAEKLRRKWKTKSSQLWEIGRHRLLCGDATNAGDVERLLSTNKISLLATSPPYFVGKEYEKNLSWEDFLSLISSFLKFGFKFLKNGGYVFVNFSENTDKPEAMAEIYRRSALSAGLIWHSHRVWKRPAAMPIYVSITPRPVGEIEYLHTYRKGRSREKVRNIQISSRMLWETRGPETDNHSAAFSLELIRNPILIYSDRKDFIYDPFLGSGTTMVAAEQLNRVCYGMEIEPKYVAVTLERMSTMGLEPKLLS